MEKLTRKLKADFRPYKYKHAKKHFYCPLCGTERAFTLGHKLTSENYLQIIVITFFISIFLFPFMGFESLYSFFMVWAGLEIGFKINFRKEIGCPHCGFDASWYKKDVKVARKLVNEFWNLKASGKGPLPTEENTQGQASDTST